jgi:hypothetical protein
MGMLPYLLPAGTTSSSTGTLLEPGIVLLFVLMSVASRAYLMCVCSYGLVSPPFCCYTLLTTHAVVALPLAFWMLGFFAVNSVWFAIVHEIGVSANAYFWRLIQVPSFLIAGLGYTLLM